MGSDIETPQARESLKNALEWKQTRKWYLGLPARVTASGLYASPLKEERERKQVGEPPIGVEKGQYDVQRSVRHAQPLPRQNPRSIRMLKRLLITRTPERWCWFHPRETTRT